MEIIFTIHVKQRMKKRGITEEEVITTINFPEKTSKKEGIYYAKKDIGRANIEVVYEKDKYINVVTVYYL